MQQLTLDHAFAAKRPKTPKIDRIYASWKPPAVSIGNDLDKAVRDAIKASMDASTADGYSATIHIYYEDGLIENRLFTRGSFTSADHNGKKVSYWDLRRPNNESKNPNQPIRPD